MLISKAWLIEVSFDFASEPSTFESYVWNKQMHGYKVSIVTFSFRKFNIHKTWVASLVDSDIFDQATYSLLVEHEQLGHDLLT